MTDRTPDELAAHYKLCEELCNHEDEQRLLMGLYNTFCCDQGPETDIMRKAILVRLDTLRGITWVKR